MPGTPTEVEQMSFAQEKELSFPWGPKTPGEAYEVRPPASSPTEDPMWYRETRSDGLGWEVLFHRHQLTRHSNLITSPASNTSMAP